MLMEDKNLVPRISALEHICFPSENRVFTPKNGNFKRENDDQPVDLDGFRELSIFRETHMLQRCGTFYHDLPTFG